MKGGRSAHPRLRHCLCQLCTRSPPVCRALPAREWTHLRITACCPLSHPSRRGTLHGHARSHDRAACANRANTVEHSTRATRCPFRTLHDHCERDVHFHGHATHFVPALTECRASFLWQAMASDEIPEADIIAVWHTVWLTPELLKRFTKAKVCRAASRVHRHSHWYQNRCQHPTHTPPTDCTVAILQSTAPSFVVQCPPSTNSLTTTGHSH